VTRTRLPAAEPIEAARLRLEPLRAEDANEMAVLLDDTRLHVYTGGVPAPVEHLRARYAAVDRGWLNWVVRKRHAGEAVGTVQATLADEDGGLAATLAWVIVPEHQGNGYAAEAATAMAAWLKTHGVELLIAHIHPDHRASIAVARRLGLVPGAAGPDGEIRWAAPVTPRTASR
jgi:RimJ/RimL family protein N-acetyltransferase